MANKTRTARDIAIEVLNRFDLKLNYAGAILDEILNQTSERQRTTDLVFGTLRNRNAIDNVIAVFSNRPVERITGILLNIIRVAVFELIYSPATPEYSIVNEAVEIAKSAGGNRQTGFVNATLRQITRHITARQIQLNQANLKRTLPQSPTTGCQFDTCFLPDSAAQPADYLSTVFSLPKWLITDWLSEFGIECTQQICFASNRRPGIYIRPNTLKTTTQELAEKLHQAGVDAEIVPKMEIIQLKGPQAITKLPGFTEGLFTVQDITASQMVRLLQPQPHWRILDLCAAPGTKTTQLAELTGDSAEIVATDIDSERLKKVEENVTRLGVKSVTIIDYEKLFQNSQFSILHSKFDAVLLDVPCSNTGVLAKRIETRYRLNPKAIEQLTKTQMELLHKAVRFGVKPSGKICYSTCSIQMAENNRLIKKFLQKHSDFTLESEQFILPSADEFDRDGGYVAIIMKSKA
jgi:16S rRNA (cytosine967-C5)-methyltransferase